MKRHYQIATDEMALCIGDNVIIGITLKGEHYQSIWGCIGTIVTQYKEFYGVTIQGHYNPRSAKGYYWFTENQIKKIIIDEGDIKMNNAKINKNHILNDKHRIALIKFIEGKRTDTTYAYLLFDNNIQTDDYVVVKSAHHGFSIGQIDDIIEDKDSIETIINNNSDTVNREVVAKFDMLFYKYRLARREELANKEQKRKALKKKMDEKLAEFQHLALYEMMAESNPEIKAMLEEYKSLMN